MTWYNHGDKFTFTPGGPVCGRASDLSMTDGSIGIQSVSVDGLIVSKQAGRKVRGCVDV